MDPASPPPNSAKKDSILPWIIAAGVCGLVGTVLIVNGFVLMRTRTTTAGRLAEMEKSMAEGDRLARVTPPPSGAAREPVPETDDAASATHAGALFQAPPDWVPVYTETSRAPHSTRRDEKGVIKGMMTIDTADALDKVKDFYKGKLTDEGFELTVDQSVTRLFEHAEITARKDGGKMTARTIMHRAKGQTVVNVSYTDAENVEAGPGEGASATATSGASPNPGWTLHAAHPNAPLPVWLPVYPSLKAESQTVALAGDLGGASGEQDFDSADSVAKVRAFYYARFKESGYSIDSGVGPAQGVESAILKATKDGGKFNATVAIKAGTGVTHVSLTFSGPL